MDRALEKYKKPKVFLKDIACIATLLVFILLLTYRSEYEFTRPCGSAGNVSIGELSLRFPFNKDSYAVEFSECIHQKPTAAPQNATVAPSTAPPTAAPTTKAPTTKAPTTVTSTNKISRRRRSNDLSSDYSNVFDTRGAVYDGESSMAFAIIAFLGALWSLVACIYYCASDCKKSNFEGADVFLTLILAALTTIVSALFTAVVSHLSNENFVANVINKCSTDSEEICELNESGSFLQLYFALAFGYLAAILFFLNVFCLVACKEESYATLDGQQQQQENIPVQDKKTTYDAV